MAIHPRILALVAAIAGSVLVGLGIVYLVVACQDLPGILGPHPGDTAPRTPLGAALTVLGVVVLGLAVIAARRRPPNQHLHS